MLNLYDLTQGALCQSLYQIFICYYLVLKGLVMKFFVFCILTLIFIGSLDPRNTDTTVSVVFGVLSLLSFASLFVSEKSLLEWSENV